MSSTARFILLGLGVLAVATAAVTLAITRPWEHTSAPDSGGITTSTTFPPTPGPSPEPADTGSQTTTEPPADTNPDHEKTALQAAKIMTTWSPAEDSTRTDAELRARHLMTDERAAQVITPERPATGADWLTAAEHNATSQPHVELNDATDADGVSVTATWDWVTDDGETLPANGEPQQRIYYFHFDQEGHIADYTYQ